MLHDMSYNNLIVELFRNKLHDLVIEDAVKVCRIIYSRALLLRIT